MVQKIRYTVSQGLEFKIDIVFGKCLTLQLQQFVPELKTLRLPSTQETTTIFSTDSGQQARNEIDVVENFFKF